MINQDGLEWIEGRYGPSPRWVREPSTEVIESLARQHLFLPPTDRCEVFFHGEAACFHKLFHVIPGGGLGPGYIMRVALPVDPHYMTSSEVATMEYVRSFTTIPIPNVIAYNSSNRNPLGFEWILMECPHGRPLKVRWRALTMTAKERLVRQLARYQAQLCAKKFDQIGNLYRAPSSPTSSPFFLGRLVHEDFYWGDRIHETVPRGPFNNSHAWLSARLALVRFDHERVLASPDSNEDDRNDASVGLAISQRVLKHLANVFPPAQSESPFLVHDNLNMENIFVDEHGVVTAVLGWEEMSVLPHWRACQMPIFLDRRARYTPPQRLQYFQDEHGTIDELYWEHLLEFETPPLQKTYLDEMQRLCPEWVEVIRGSQVQTPFELAVSRNTSWAKDTDDWLVSFEDGNPPCSLDHVPPRGPPEMGATVVRVGYARL
ncbi:MAG: hypothetical protein M1826_000834 [Phylliscum demangeonii]|nr:MAG: hypothetical protein M1826_000834 [Phylliscum demangeonii]